MATSEHLEFDEGARHQRQQESSGDHLDDGLPGSVLGGVEGIEQAAQFSNVVGGGVSVQANTCKCTSGAVLGGSAVQKFVEVLLAQEDHVINQCGFLWVSHRAGTRNAKTATQADFLGSGESN